MTPRLPVSPVRRPTARAEGSLTQPGGFDGSIVDPGAEWTDQIPNEGPGCRCAGFGCRKMIAELWSAGQAPLFDVTPDQVL
jgi:hypothetical protein